MLPTITFPGQMGDLNRMSFQGILCSRFFVPFKPGRNYNNIWGGLGGFTGQASLPGLGQAPSLHRTGQGTREREWVGVVGARGCAGGGGLGSCRKSKQPSWRQVVCEKGDGSTLLSRWRTIKTIGTIKVSQGTVQNKLKRRARQMDSRTG